LFTLNSIDWLSSRAVPVADILLPSLGDASSAVCVLYSFLRLGERLGNTAEVWKSVESMVHRVALSWASPKKSTAREIQPQQQQRKLCFKPLSLVVVMSVVHLWKGAKWSQDRRVVSAVCCATFVRVAEKSAGCSG